jgi:hypothetical protein
VLPGRTQYALLPSAAIASASIDLPAATFLSLSKLVCSSHPATECSEQRRVELDQGATRTIRPSQPPHPERHRRISPFPTYGRQVAEMDVKVRTHPSLSLEYARATSSQCCDSQNHTLPPLHKPCAALLTSLLATATPATSTRQK